MAIFNSYVSLPEGNEDIYQALNRMNPLKKTGVN
jgi:hypothetical protein